MKSINVKSLLEEKLVVGAKVRYGVRFAQEHFCKAGDVITLVEGYFERENGLYTETEKCPAEWDEDAKDFNSIYHIWGNDLEDFMDCEILEEEYAQQSQPSGMRWVVPKTFDVRIKANVDKAALESGLWDKLLYASKTLEEYKGIKNKFIQAIGNIVPEDLFKPASESSPAGAAEGASEGMAEALRLLIDKHSEYDDHGRWVLTLAGFESVLDEAASLSPGVEDGSGWVKVEDRFPRCGGW